MPQDHVCTPFELKEFAYSERNPTAFNFARFIECKSRFKYTVIEIEFLLDVFKVLEEHIQFSSNLSRNFEDKWKNLNIPTVKLF